MIELGLGAVEALSVPGTGRVAGVFAKAAYLHAPGGLVGLTTLDVPSGPVHARAPVALDRLRVDDRVVVTPSLMQAGPLLLGLEGARVWRGSLPTAAALEAGLRVAVELLERAPPSLLEEAVVGSAVDLVRQGDLVRLTAQLGGLGPGLTPAGDDCLAGILLVASIRWGAAAGQLLADLAAAVETNDVALTFLRWAARGQSIEPVHRFLICAAARDGRGAGQALDALISFGHSSGADLALGLRLGLRLLPPSPPVGAAQPGCNGMDAR